MRQPKKSRSLSPRQAMLCAVKQTRPRGHRATLVHGDVRAKLQKRAWRRDTRQESAIPKRCALVGWSPVTA